LEKKTDRPKFEWWIYRERIKQNPAVAIFPSGISSVGGRSGRKIQRRLQLGAENGDFTDNEQSSHNSIQRGATPQNAIEIGWRAPL